MQINASHLIRKYCSNKYKKVQPTELSERLECRSAVAAATHKATRTMANSGFVTMVIAPEAEAV